MLIAVAHHARQRRLHRQAGFTLVELLIVIAILAALAAIVLFNISGVSTNSKCSQIGTDGATIQSAADTYFNQYGVYPVGTTASPVPGTSDVATPASGTTVNQGELLTASLLHSATAGWAAPATGQENFTYKASPPSGTVTGAWQGGAPACKYNP